jgi:hypothetical protein
MAMPTMNVKTGTLFRENEFGKPGRGDQGKQGVIKQGFINVKNGPALPLAANPLPYGPTPTEFSIMSKTTIAFGLLLIIQGVAFWAGTGFAHMTSLIPAFVGLPVAVLGLIGLKGSEGARKHCAHVAVMLTTLGVLAGLGRGIPGLFKEGGNMTAVTATLIMGAICAVHVFLSVKSFIAARKAREAAEAGNGGE